MVITLSGTFVVLRHAAQTRHYDSPNKSVEIISQVTKGFFSYCFFLFFMQSSPRSLRHPFFSPLLLSSSPPSHLPPGLSRDVTPLPATAAPRTVPTGKKKTHVSQATHSSAALMCAVRDTVHFRSEYQGIYLFFSPAD